MDVSVYLAAPGDQDIMKTVCPRLMYLQNIFSYYDKKEKKVFMTYIEWLHSVVFEGGFLGTCQLSPI